MIAINQSYRPQLVTLTAVTDYYQLPSAHSPRNRSLFKTLPEEKPQTPLCCVKIYLSVSVFDLSK